MKALLPIFLIALSVSACSKDAVAKRVLFDGQAFKSKVAHERGSNDFTILVKDAAKSLEGARQAGIWEANKFCIKNFGQSDKEWINGPFVEDGALVIVDGTLQLTGRCSL